MVSTSIDAILEQVSLSFDGLKAFIAETTTAEDTDDSLYAFGETTDLFHVWLRDTGVAREECSSYEDCLRNNTELRLTIHEILVDIKEDLSEGKFCGGIAVKGTIADAA